MDDALGDADEENDCITAEEDTEYRKQIVTNWIHLYDQPRHL